MEYPILISESTLTDRYQTTVPDTVRKALRLNKREKIRYTIQPNGSVLLSRADQGDADPILDNFLSFLASDIRDNPSNLKVMPAELMTRIEHLVGDIDVDLHAPLDDRDE